jgi:hypothetical protein
MLLHISFARFSLSPSSTISTFLAAAAAAAEAATASMGTCIFNPMVIVCGVDKLKSDHKTKKSRLQNLMRITSG